MRSHIKRLFTRKELAGRTCFNIILNCKMSFAQCCRHYGTREGMKQLDLYRENCKNWPVIRQLRLPTHGLVDKRIPFCHRLGVLNNEHVSSIQRYNFLKAAIEEMLSRKAYPKT
ncbi:hypothetical protein HPP92_014352 [Vanilla planifolia]|uniref:Uncharacterized protein n=1 Tax=Vanilla planifolia TaxID=51239 RepID=A0A835QUS2_VANPL|nr:hypothetical protein HPP92_014352 [Vanilla planifolia]